MKIPSFFKVRTAQENREHFLLDHSNQTTTDFFRLKPAMIREMVPQDKFTAHIESLCRFLPMPLPTYGSINFANRAFFVPARQLMEGFNEFLEGTPYRNGAGTYNISHVPQIANSTFADYIKDLSEPFYKLMTLSIDLSEDAVFGGRVIVFLDQQGRVLYIDTTAQATQSGSPVPLVYSVESGVFMPISFGGSLQDDIESAITKAYKTGFPTYSIGDFDVTASDALTLSTYGVHLFGDPSSYEAVFPVSGNPDFKLLLDSVEFLPSSLENYTIQHFDFIFAFVAYRFTKQAKNVYDLLKNLGYSVDFSSGLVSSSYVWLNDQYVSAMQLLAYFRVYLDYYLDPQYYGTLQSKYALFFGVNKTLLKSDLADIASMLVVNYDRDYFTAAWNNPSGPNSSVVSGASSVPSFVDINSTDPTSQSINIVSGSGGNSNYYNDTPLIKRNAPTSTAPYGITQYMIDALKMVSDYMHRHQLAGYRAFDRFFAEFGVKLSDDRVGRCYFLDSQNYSTTVKDIMSTAATQDASLGDYAGKAVAYSGKKDISYEADEFGYFIIMSSCTPTVGYVQGTKRENFHLSRYDFHRGQFDNLGVQAIRKDEIFADYGLSSFDGKGIASYPSNWSPDGVFGFSPRYAEYKVGFDILSGDFIIPSRRAGLDAFHLYRLFSGRDSIDLGQSFVTGDQSQYDRIFNNTSDEYDHIYQVHSIVIDALRPMKSITEVICFDDDHGKEINIPANGSMVN